VYQASGTRDSFLIPLVKLKYLQLDIPLTRSAFGSPLTHLEHINEILRKIIQCMAEMTQNVWIVRLTGNIEGRTKENWEESMVQTKRIE